MSEDFTADMRTLNPISPIRFKYNVSCFEAN